jgi:phosphate starvation-inducible protein PhoH
MGKTDSSKKKNSNRFEISKNEINVREKDVINKIIDEHINLSAKNDSQRKLLKAIKENQITICNGVAGSGKTLCSIYMALSLLMDRNNFFPEDIVS